MKKINKGYKVFISYKYMDSSVWQLPDRKDVELGRTTARNYVDIIQEYFEDSSHINKGEKKTERTYLISKKKQLLLSCAIRSTIVV